MKKTVIMHGCSQRADVATKARVVNILLNTKFKSEEDRNEFITATAAEFSVQVNTIERWVNDFKFIYKEAMHALPGTRSIAHTVIQGPINIKLVKDYTDKKRLEVYKFVKQYDSAPLSTADTDTTREHFHNYKVKIEETQK